MSKIFSNYGPILNENDIIITGRQTNIPGSVYEVYPMPDSIQNGPIFNREIKCTDGHENPHPSFLPTKNIDLPFPIDMKYPCYLPLKNNKKCQDLFESDGNCIDIFHKQDSDYLLYLHEGTEEKQEIYFSEIFLDTVKGSPTEGLISLGKETIVTNLHKVDQLKSSVLNDNSFGLFRGYKTVVFANLDIKELNFTNVPISLTDCCLNNRLLGYFAVASSNGRVYIFDSSRSLPLWTATLGPLSEPNNLKCQFSNDPLTLLIGSNSEIWAADSRSINAKRKIFSTEVFNISKTYEKSYSISSFIDVPNSSYLFINCPGITYLYDERNCKGPVLKWQNMVTEQPTFTRLNVVKDIKVLSLSGNYFNSLGLITTRFNSSTHSEIFTQGISTPKHFGILSSSMNYANKKDMWFSLDIKKNIKSHWKGMASFNLGDNSFCNVMQNRLGNLFYQIFKMKDDDVDTHLNPNIDNILLEFENEISKPNKCPYGIKMNCAPLKYIYPAEQMPCSRPVKNPYILKKSPAELSYWQVNKKVTAQINRIGKQEYVDEYIFDDEAAKNFISTGDPINVFPKEFHSKISPTAICQYNDTLAKKIISEWDVSPTNEHTLNRDGNLEVYFQRVPSTFIHSIENISKLRKCKVQDESKENDSVDKVEQEGKFRKSKEEVNSKPNYSLRDKVTLEVFNTPEPLHRSTPYSVKTKKKRKSVSGF